MKALRVLAVLLALSLMIGELWRSSGAGRPFAFVIDDQIIGGFLLVAAYAMRIDTIRTRSAFAAAWGMSAGMLYGSFFGKLVTPETINAGNWDLGILTWLVGLAFVVALLGLAATLALPLAPTDKLGTQS